MPARVAGLTFTIVAPAPQSDEELAWQSQAGSLTAFEELVSRYERRIYSFVFNSCRNEADARELTQDTFVKAFHALAQFDSRHHFSTWVFAIARRKCIDHFRARRVRDQDPEPEAAHVDDPSELLARSEETRALWDAARRCLPPSQFQALWLRYVEDMSVAQVALVLRKTATHVKVLLFRARQSLAKELRSEGAHPNTAGTAAKNESADSVFLPG